MKRFFICAMLLLGANVAAAFAGEIPPAPVHFVTDKSGALSPTASQALENQLHDYQTKTGHQVIVYIAPGTGGVPLEDYTSQAGHAWHVGQKGKDDGAILFLFTADKKVRIETGYGLESVLTDAKSRRIIDSQIVPQMKAGNTDAAVRDGVNGIISTIDGTASSATTDETSPNADGGSASTADAIKRLFAFGFVALLLILVIVKHARRGGRNAYDGSTSTIYSTGSSNSSGDSGFSFSGGGGDFGGGGASGSW